MAGRIEPMLLSCNHVLDISRMLCGCVLTKFEPFVEFLVFFGVILRRIEPFLFSNSFISFVGGALSKGILSEGIALLVNRFVPKRM